MPLFKPVKKSILMPEAIVRQVEKKILLGQLRPQSTLPSEKDLQKQFAVSRNTVREALKMLEASGIIKIKRGSRGGSTVTEVSNEFISDFLVKAIRMGGFSGETIAQFRLALEPSIAEIVARMGIPPKLLTQMETNVTEANNLFKANKLTGYKNMDFHVLLALATENPMFTIILKTLRVTLYMVTPKFVIKRKQRSTIEHHQRILEFLKRRDPDNARIQMYEHLAELSESIKHLPVKEITHAGD